MPRHAAHFRLKLRGPIYQVRFTRKGHEHRLSCETGDQGRARQEAARLVLEHDAGTACKVCGGGGAKVSGPTGQLAEAWLKSMKDRPEAYKKRAATDLNQYIIDRWASPDLITSKEWENAKIELHTTKTERRERLSWGSIANLATTLRNFLGFCASVGALESIPQIRNPTSKQLASSRAYLRPLDASEQAAFLWALALEGESRALRIYIALFETWMRKGALAAMTPRWINFAREQIRIPSAYTKNQTGDLEIDLTPRAAEAIRGEMDRSGSSTGRTPGCNPGDGGSTPPHSTIIALDEPIFGPFNYRSLFERMAAVAGLDPKGLTAHHVTRRTAATLGGAKPGASLAAMKSQGGWKSSEVVDRYMRPSVEAARKVTR